MKHVLLQIAILPILLAGVAVAGHGPCSAELDDCLSGMTKQFGTRGWVGIELDRQEDGTLLIERVVPDSPAQAAGIEPGDRITELNGVPYRNADRGALKEAYKAMVAGNTITYTIERAGDELRVEIRLAHLPDTLRAQWIAQHLLEGHSKQAGAKKSTADP
ncbi:MAG: PDZ domain-containing protein [bacterium]|nr:PDZ domain-containing protein [bacterium]